MSYWVKDNPNVLGPFIVWSNYGVEGWQPQSYSTLKEAIEAEKYSGYVITRPVSFAVVEQNV